MTMLLFIGQWRRHLPFVATPNCFFALQIWLYILLSLLLLFNASWPLLCFSAALTLFVSNCNWGWPRRELTASHRRRVKKGASSFVVSLSTWPRYVIFSRRGFWTDKGNHSQLVKYAVNQDYNWSAGVIGTERESFTADQQGGLHNRRNYSSMNS